MKRQQILPLVLGSNKRHVWVVFMQFVIPFITLFLCAKFDGCHVLSPGMNWRYSFCLLLPINFSSPENGGRLT